jgi:hypothetical protein
VGDAYKFAPDASLQTELESLEAKLDRLYSRFPGGSIGLALFLLRLADGLGLLGEGIHALPSGTSSEPTSLLVLTLVLAGSAVLLILGLRTSFAGGVAATSTAAVALHSKHTVYLLGSEMYAWAFLFALVFFLSASFALLGPGAYSLDARLSGWRMITLSSGQSSAKAEEEGHHVDR